MAKTTTHISTWLCLAILCSSSLAVRYDPYRELTKEVVEGFDVTISCVIQDIPGSSNVIFHWSVPTMGQTLTSTSFNQSDRFVVTEEIPGPTGDSATVTGSSTLTISKARTSDDGVYRCQLLPSTPDGEILATIETDLSVIQFDPQTNAACWVEPTSTPILDDTTSFRCATRQSTPVQLSWEANGVELDGEQTKSDGVTFLYQELDVPVSWDKIPFSCLNVETREVLCTTSVSLLYPPVAEVIPDGEILYGSEARFSCNTTARPEVTGYRWRYDEFPVNPNTHHRFNRVRLENDNRTMVLPALSAVDDAGVNIFCEAFNDIGTGVSAPYEIVGKEPTPIANIIGPILLVVIIIIILLVVLAFYCWWRGQRRMVRKISTKRKRVNNARQKSELPTSLNDYSGSASFVAVSPMDLEAIGYGPDVSSKPSQVEPNDRQDRDSGVGDDGIRPIPRRGSISSSLGKANFGYEDDEQSQSDMNFESPDAPVDPSEEKLKSYSYEVNPNFNNYRRSQTFDVVAIPNSEHGDSDTEIKSLPSDAGGSDDESGHSATPSGHIVSTNL